MAEKLAKSCLGARAEEDRTDWKRVNAVTDEELRHAICIDPDTLEPRVDWIRKAPFLPAYYETQEKDYAADGE